MSRPSTLLCGLLLLLVTAGACDCESMLSTKRREGDLTRSEGAQSLPEPEPAPEPAPRPLRQTPRESAKPRPERRAESARPAPAPQPLPAETAVPVEKEVPVAVPAPVPAEEGQRRVRSRERILDLRERKVRLPARVAPEQRLGTFEKVSPQAAEPSP